MITWYRFLLRLLPSRFRDEFGPDLVQLARDHMRDARRHGPWAELHQTLRLAADLIGQAFLERSAILRRRIARRRSVAESRQLIPGHGGRLMMDTLIHDVRFALRGFGRAPGFAVAAVLTLGLGIGATTAVFSLIDGILLQPLRFGEPEQLVAVWETSPREGIEKSQTSTSLFYDWREQTRTFSDLTGWAWDTFILAGDDGTESKVVNGIWVYPNFFNTLRVRPLLGRAFDDTDASPGEQPDVVMVSHALWRDRWGADREVIGRKVTVRGTPVTVVGVMPPNLAVPDPQVDIWMPAVWKVRGIYWERYNRWLEVCGRLAPGITLAQATADVSRITKSLTSGELEQVYDGWDATVEPLQQHVVGAAGAKLWLALAAVGLVLLIACVNIANMLLARAAAREREVGVRRALGASGGRISRQLLTESVVLGLGGGLVGAGLAYATHRFILSLQPDILPRAHELALNATALVFAFAVSLATGIAFGLAPALQSRGVNLRESLQEGGTRASTAGGGRNRLRAVLVTMQLALTVTLLCGAGLLVRSLLKLGSVDPGFEPRGAVAALVDLDQRKYDTEEKVRLYFQQVRDKLSNIPGVVSVGASSALPMDPMGINYDLPYRRVGQEDLKSHELPQADFRVVSPGYFETLQVPLVSGRAFTGSDLPDAPFVAVVNRSMAEEIWPGKDPVGERFETPSTDWAWFEVVGVVGDTRYYGLGDESRAEIYVVDAQVPRSFMSFVVRTERDAASITGAVRREILRHDPAQPAHTIVPMDALVADSIAAEKFYALVLAVFAAVALLLSTIGVYSVLSYWVGQRTHEIGIRVALGADRSDVVSLVVQRGMWLAAVGAGMGLLGAWGATRVLESVLFDIGATDPITYLSVTGLLLGTALAACWIPARRASRLDPVGALRA